MDKFIKDKYNVESDELVMIPGDGTPCNTKKIAHTLNYDLT